MKIRLYLRAFWFSIHYLSVGRFVTDKTAFLPVTYHRYVKDVQRHRRYCGISRVVVQSECLWSDLLSATTTDNSNNVRGISSHCSLQNSSLKRKSFHGWNTIFFLQYWVLYVCLRPASNQVETRLKVVWLNALTPSCLRRGSGRGDRDGPRR